MLCVFFFKQKTAYEMRISDWSSDVCSSDLAAAHREHEAARGQGHRARAGPVRVRFRAEFRRLGAAEGTRRGGHRNHAALCRTAQPRRHRRSIEPAARRMYRSIRSDRKSVVEGKSVSVRVDLGGRLIIQKKKKKK